MTSGLLFTGENSAGSIGVLPANRSQAVVRHKIATWRYIKRRMDRAVADCRFTDAGVWWTLRLKMIGELTRGR